MSSPVSERRFARGRAYVRFVGELVRLHPSLFSVAILGATIYAVGTVASSEVVRWIIGNIVVPRFDEGGVSTGTVVAGCALVIGVGVVRSGGVVLRRWYAGRFEWRVAQTLTDRVNDRLVHQPVSWHRRQSDGQLLARAGVDIDTTVSALAPIPFAIGTVVLVFVSATWLLTSTSGTGMRASRWW